MSKERANIYEAIMSSAVSHRLRLVKFIGNGERTWLGRRPEYFRVTIQESWIPRHQSDTKMLLHYIQMNRGNYVLGDYLNYRDLMKSSLHSYVHTSQAQA